jgi:Uncharacterized protein conserved in bacteria
MKAVVTICLLLCSLAATAQTPATPQLDIPKGMKQYYIGFLVRGPNYTSNMPKEERDALLQKHLAYIRSQAEAGKYKLAGPFLDKGNIAGMLIIDTATEADAKEIVSHDPMVQSGRLAVEIHPAMLADLSCVLMEYQKAGGK